MSAPAPAPPTRRDVADEGPQGVYRPVVGDGTTGASRARMRWRRWRWPVGVVAVLVLLAIALAYARPPQSLEPLAPDNPTETGAQALSRVLSDHGVTTTYVRRTTDAVEAATAGTTLLVVDNGWLDPDQLDALHDTEADLVLVEPGRDTLAVLSGGDLEPGGGWSSTTSRTADCDDPDAVAAVRLRSPGPGLEVTGGDFVTCFPADPGGPGVYAVGTDSGREVRVLTTGEPLLNRSITDAGNAALTLRALGRTATLVWYVPDPDEYYHRSDDGGTTPGAVLPPWAGVVWLQVLLVAAVAILWRARRLGRLVPEQLPVTVRAAETTRGRGRLYRRSGSRGHAAAGLRAATADRLAAALGVPRSAPAPTLIDAVSRATGRADVEIAGLLYGPPPVDDAALLALAHHLDLIESEVHRP